ncbi:hypothetical protein H6G20_24680 [Desertifilum sp. FACHB-1129]|uniref:Uncharacterized protein n=2 Tax=Desertifilum tharense IPPAS B-1220 TaxID=1781255 RepID=A0A1E5QF76_9CYAN|nr:MULTISPECIES: hypothetical protein [Desertifilum]MDA0213053.1 hypothetical protein [Cyanobacteria bacterium FC1]MBD2314868.1 hypothetical protein [Desertifilum sp. FACHB-1129]MBD2324861.1 hypothetical protein [Desertifilum sp. FACHB-866]MBD2334891.1 hypothetical protein [Desertifilum sp. FACHB-868]OEJ73340.1 hypothetical protein BH720_20180 [Desertifilum tharense IPPAS B-1220]
MKSTLIKTSHWLLKGISLCVLAMSVADAGVASPVVQAEPLVIAQSRNYCLQHESLFVVAETRDYWVNICGGDNPGHYVGVNKRNGDSIRVRLYDYDRQGNYFEAINGDVSYLLIRGTTKGDFLTVTQGSRELLRQPILRWQ